MSTHTVSVIVTSYNYEDFVIDAVNSALKQTRKPLEVIVVDDGSTDNSLHKLELAFREDPIVRIISRPNGGQMSAWIAGCDVAQGSIIALLDSDDLWKTDYLEKIVATYSTNQVLISSIAICKSSGLLRIMLTRQRHMKSRDLGLSILMGAYRQRWQGVATSGNTLKKDLLTKILQLPKSGS